MSTQDDSSNQLLTSISFEAAFTRLEEILEQLNAATVTLDDSLKLYEEANRLIAICNKRLNEAERKIEVLSKNRNGDLILDHEGHPLATAVKANS